MADSGKIMVTGATGTVGSLLIPNLTNLGADVRALVRDESKAQGLKDAGVEVVVGDLDKPDTLDAGFRGVDKIFLITAPNPNQVTQANNGIEAAKRNGNPFLARLSSGATRDTPGALPLIAEQHAEIDRRVKASGLPYNLLQPHFFMQNTMMSAQTVASDGAVYIPFEAGKIGMIDARDIADVKATGHSNVPALLEKNELYELQRRHICLVIRNTLGFCVHGHLHLMTVIYSSPSTFNSD